MQALVIYESMFGNTRAIGESIAAGIASHAPTDVFEVRAVPSVLADDYDLLVVGGPTHAFGMSRESTRQSAVEQGAPASQADRGIREWLAMLSPGLRLRHGATFDTRVAKPRLPGSAAKKAARALRRLGVDVATEPESFFVSGMSGPLVDGELERARAWGESVALAILRRDHQPA